MLRFNGKARTPLVEMMRLRRIATIGVILTSLAWSSGGAVVPGQDRLEPDTTKVLVMGSPPSQGPADARVNVVAFIDFQCPSCREFAQWMADLPAEEAHAIRIVIRQKPFPFHTWAREAAMISVCVDSQDHRAFWKLHDFLFAQQSELTAENVKPRLLDYARDQLHMDSEAINACLEHHGYEDVLASDRQLAVQLNIRETPTVFINGRRYVGFRSAQDLKLAIDAALAPARRDPESPLTPAK